MSVLHNQWLYRWGIQKALWERECGFNTGDALFSAQFWSQLLVIIKKKSGKPLSNLIFGSTENDLVRTPHYSYWKESTSLLFQSSLEKHGVLSIL